MRKIVLSALLGISAFAAIEPLPIPRLQTKRFYDAGLFEGGTSQRANLENIRLAFHPGFERWVIDFSNDPKPTTPRFQLHYKKAETGVTSEGFPTQIRPARFVLLLRSIRHNRILAGRTAALIKQSQLVDEVLIYPQIENGDMGIEFILKEEVMFEPHQPSKQQGRLVLDMKPIVAASAPKPVAGKGK